jgi:hypothetical protein
VKDAVIAVLGKEWDDPFKDLAAVPRFVNALRVENERDFPAVGAGHERGLQARVIDFLLKQDAFRFGKHPLDQVEHAAGFDLKAVAHHVEKDVAPGIQRENGLAHEIPQLRAACGTNAIL